MTRILFEIGGEKYYRNSHYIYFDMYINDKIKCLPLMRNNWKLNYDYENYNFDDIYTYYWDENWGWVKDEYIELPDEDLCSCKNDVGFIKKGKYITCSICRKVVVFFSV